MAPSVRAETPMELSEIAKLIGLDDPKTLALAEELVQIKNLLETPEFRRLSNVNEFGRRSLTKKFRLLSRAFSSLLAVKMKLNLEVFIIDYE